MEKIVRMGYSLKKNPKAPLQAGGRRASLPHYATMQTKTCRSNGHGVPPANSMRKNRGKNGGFCGGAPGRDANLYSDLSKPIFGERDPTRDTSKITGQKRAWCKA